MKKNGIQKIEIKNIYLERWNNMNIIKKDSVRPSYKRVAIDFNPLSDKEIFDFLNQKSRQKDNDKICGQFSEIQLQAINQNVVIGKVNYANLLYVSILVMTLLVISACNSTKKLENITHEKPFSNIKIIESSINSDSLSTTKIIGKVMDIKNQPLIGVRIYIENSKIGIKTGFDGEFELIVAKEPNETVKVKINYIDKQGVVSEVTVPMKAIKNKEIEVILIEGVEIVLDKETVIQGEDTVIRNSWYKRLWQRIFSSYSNY
ncbi:MAG: hypothetical protein ACI97N_000444 [Cognaticolwellia sp.]|jgi:hypothetical protein